MGLTDEDDAADADLDGAAHVELFDNEVRVLRAPPGCFYLRCLCCEIAPCGLHLLRGVSGFDRALALGALLMSCVGCAGCAAQAGVRRLQRVPRPAPLQWGRRGLA